MVALAPNTSETSPWDVLDTFPKLHSRAREVKTTKCTEAPRSKSLSRVEIWQVVFESRGGLESFTRDPIGYEDGWSLYSDFFFLSGTDPDGESVHSCSSSEVKFEQGVKDTSPGGTTGFPGLAEKLGKLLKVSGLSVYWDFQVSGYMRRRDCIEDCECNRSASYSRTDSGAKGTILFGFSIPVGPNPLLTVKGDMRFNADMTLTVENGGCAGIRKTKFCGSFSGGGQIKLCAGKKLFFETCVGVKISCNMMGTCGAVNGSGNSPTQGKCTATIFGGACIANGWLCGETDIGNINSNLPFM